MWDNFAPLVVALIWVAHALALLALAWFSRDTSFECRAMVTLYLFFSVAPLFSFETQVFQYPVTYTPSVLPLSPYLVTDLLLLLLVRYLFAISALRSKQIPVWSPDTQAGFKVLLLIAMLAQCIHVAFNF